MTVKLGDVVVYRGAEFQGQPAFAALVCFVHSQKLVNLVVYMSNGVAVERQNVEFIALGDAVPGEASYAQHRAVEAS